MQQNFSADVAGSFGFRDRLIFVGTSYGLPSFRMFAESVKSQRLATEVGLSALIAEKVAVFGDVLQRLPHPAIVQSPFMHLQLISVLKRLRTLFALDLLRLMRHFHVSLQFPLAHEHHGALGALVSLFFEVLVLSSAVESIFVSVESVLVFVSLEAFVASDFRSSMISPEMRLQRLLIGAGDGAFGTHDLLLLFFVFRLGAVALAGVYAQVIPIS